MNFRKPNKIRNNLRTLKDLEKLCDCGSHCECYEPTPETLRREAIKRIIHWRKKWVVASEKEKKNIEQNKSKYSEETIKMAQELSREFLRLLYKEISSRAAELMDFLNIEEKDLPEEWRDD